MLKISDIIVDPELEALLPELSEQENVELMRSIDRDGFRDPIIVWLGHSILVDGHNRLRIKQTLYAEDDKSPEVTEKHFADRNAAKEWMLRNQLARRNLTDAQRAVVALKLKPVVQEQADQRMKSGQPNPSQNSDEGPKKTATRTDEIVAKAAGVSRDTIRKVEAVLESGDEETKAAMLAPKSDPSHISINKAHEKTVSHITQNSGNNDWHTPAEFIEAARAVLADIDLDPASCEVANERVKAKKYFTPEDDGLSQEWRGRVWMNPPYSQPEIARFAEKFIEEFTAKRITAAIVLVNNATETEWGQSLLSGADAACFKCGRIKFLTPSGEPKNTPIQGQMFLYFGRQPAKFKDVFGKIGVCF